MSDTQAPEQHPEAPVVPEEIVITEVDRLTATNVSLKLINAVNQEALAQHALKDAQRALMEATQNRERASQESTIVRQVLSKKYGIDFSTHQINDADGKIIPRVR